MIQEQIVNLRILRSSTEPNAGVCMKVRYVALAIVFLWFFAGGIAHFALTDAFMRIVPPWIPLPLAAVYVSGVFEVLGALAILSPRSRAWGGVALIVLTVCVTPANIYMWRHPQLFPGISEGLLGARLVVQVLLIACIWWATRTARKS
jgi:uncharacterized membrane protein